jgi:hypothetical protein
MIFQFITQVEMYLPNNPLKNTLFDHYVWYLIMLPVI